MTAVVKAWLDVPEVHVTPAVVELAIRAGVHADGIARLWLGERPERPLAWLPAPMRTALERAAASSLETAIAARARALAYEPAALAAAVDAELSDSSGARLELVRAFLLETPARPVPYLTALEREACTRLAVTHAPILAVIRAATFSHPGDPRLPG